MIKPEPNNSYIGKGGRLVNRKATCLMTKNLKNDMFDDLFLAVKNWKIHKKIVKFVKNQKFIKNPLVFCCTFFTKSDTFSEI
jgi:hypothetical protein